MNKLALDRLDNLMKMTTQYINSGQFKHKKRVQPIVDIFSANNSGAAYKKDDDIITLAKKGSRKHRIALRQLIFEYIASINGLKEKDINLNLRIFFHNSESKHNLLMYPQYGINRTNQLCFHVN